MELVDLRQTQKVECNQEAAEDFTPEDAPTEGPREEGEEMNSALAKTLAVIFVLVVIAVFCTVAIGPTMTFWGFFIGAFMLVIILLCIGVVFVTFRIATWIWNMGYQPEEHPEGPL